MCKSHRALQLSPCSVAIHLPLSPQHGVASAPLHRLVFAQVLFLSRLGDFDSEHAGINSRSVRESSDDQGPLHTQAFPERWTYRFDPFRRSSFVAGVVGGSLIVELV